MKTILHVFVSLGMGGAENLLLQILRRLDPSEYRSVVCCIGDRKEIGSQIADLGVPLHEFGLLKKGGFDYRIVSKLRQLMREEKVSLVHTHLYHANLYGRLAASCEGIPVIASVHNSYPRPRWHRHLVNRWLARKCSFVTVGSEQVYDDVMRLDGVPEEKLILIPNAVDVESKNLLSRDEARRLLGVGPETFLIGTVGRLEEQKGHKHLVEAMKLLKKDHPTMKAIIVGEGRQRCFLENQIWELGLKDQVQLIGQRSDLADFFVGLDLFVMPSLWEGLALAMLSAMAAGVPVLATDVGGVRRALDEGKAGFILPAGDSERLAKEIEKALLDPEERFNRARAGFQRVRDHYSIQALVARLQELYAQSIQDCSSIK